MAKHLPVRVKYKLLKEVLEKKQSVASVCRKTKISRTIFYRWKKEFDNKPQKFLAVKERYFHQTPPYKEALVLKLALIHPEYSSHRISQTLGINHKGKLILGNHGAQNVLHRFGLSTYKERLVYQKTQTEIKKKPLWLDKKTLSAQQRLVMIRRVIEKKESVAAICKEFGISRVIFYRWLARYRKASKGLEEQSLNNKRRQIEKYWRQVNDQWVKRILDLVLAHPEFSVPKIMAALPLNEQGRPVVGYYGVQRVLERNNLNNYERRLTYRQSFAPVTLPVPIPAPAVVGKPKILRLLKAPFAAVPKLVKSPRSLLLTLFFTFSALFILKRWFSMLVEAPPGTQAGLIFATISLSFGFFFFLYSLKYYLTLILILGFSRQVSSPSASFGSAPHQTVQDSDQDKDSVQGLNGNGFVGQDFASRGKKNIFQTLFGATAAVEENGDSGNSGGSIWRRIFGLRENSRPNGNSDLRRGSTGGLAPDLSKVNLERRPFVSIHLAVYNEKRVVERLLTACTSMEYDNYEVIVVDDSTDDTVEILKKWSSRPGVKIIHRESREGYKGGALQVALQRTDPRAEFIIVFDADFLPYPDTITQFLKYFQVTAGGLNFGAGYRVEGLGSRGKENENSKPYTLSPNTSPIAAVQGYQWHVLNKSENWVTRGVRSEYAGSYVIERSGEEALGALKQISGSVYMIRKDVLDKFGWGTSITEDFELTLRLYRDGYKVVYTPYIQTPSECVSTLKRLIRQRMRWAEGHSHNIKKMFWSLIKSPKMTLPEKFEFAYLSPYYLQAAFFMVGTLCWFISETIFQVKLPFWTSLWGWSLVFTNLFSLPLMNTVGLFLEESEERDYGGILSFIALTYIVVPFQAYAAVKGFLEKEEGPWFRTPKTGKITDILAPGRFARLISAVFPGRRVANQGMAAKIYNLRILKFLKLTEPEIPVTSVSAYAKIQSGGFRPNLNLHVNRRKVRGITNFVVVVLVLISIALTYVSLPLTPTLAYTGTFYFRGTGADELTDLTSDGRKRMGTESLGTATQSFTLQGSTGAVSYYAQDTAASSLTNPTSTTVTSVPLASATRYGSQRQLFRDIYGNLIAVFVDNANDIKAAYLNVADQPWNGGDGVWDTYGTDLADAVTAQNVSAGLDSGSGGPPPTSVGLHIIYEDTAVTGGNIYYKAITVTYTSGVINSTGWTIPASTTLDDGTTSISVLRPSLVIDKNNYPAVCWSYQTISGSGSQVRFSRYNGSAWTCDTGTCTETCNNGSVNCDYVRNTAANSDFQCAIGRMPDASGTNTYDDALYIIAMQTGTTGLYAYDATTSGANYNAWALISTLSTTVGLNTSAAPYDLSVSPSHIPNQDALAGLLVAWADTSNNTTLKILRNKDGGATPDDLSPSPAANFGGSAFSVIASTSANPNIYLFYKNNINGTTAGDIVYRRHTNASPSSWDTIDQTFDSSPGDTDNYPNVKDPNLYAGASTNPYNDGGRVDALYYDGTNVKSNYIPVPYKTLTTSAGASAVETTVGTTGWDDLHFLTGVLDSGSSVGAGNWTLRACFGADYTADKVVRARWEIVTSDGISVCGTGGECGSYVNLSKGTGGAGCAENTAVTPPSVITDLNGKRLKLRINYDNDGSDVAPVRYADSTGNNGDSLLTGTLSEAANNFYVLTDNMNKKWTSGDVELPTEGTTSEQRNPSIATDTSGNSIAVWEDSRNSQNLGIWSNAGASTYVRRYHVATLLQNGKVLATGVDQAIGGSTIAEVYDPTANTWATTGPNTYVRDDNTSTLLNNGKVLVVGTASSNGGQSIPELYDPSLNTFSTTGTSFYPRYYHAATPLPSGKVLVVGTQAVVSGQTIAELFDPATQSWSTTGPTTYTRSSNTATLLGNGKVLVVGTDQSLPSNGGLSIAELYDPVANTFSTTGISTYSRYYHSAVLLQNGKVLVVGTNASNGGQTIPELYDPSSGTWSTTGATTYIRLSVTGITTLLNNGKVLVVGGSTGTGGSTIPELYDPSSGTWSTVLPTTYVRLGHTLTLLNNGKVLVTGTTASSGGQTIPELYSPQTFDIYAQKFNSSGTKQWTNDVKVNSDDGNRAISAYNPSNYDHLNPKVKLDSSNNPIIVWQESRNSVFGDDIWAQKLDSTGAKQWPAASTGTWSTTGNMTYGRDQAATALLVNGKVLAVGTTSGVYVSGGRSIAEVYDPSTNTWATTGPAGYARHGQYLLPLNSGKVLMAGNATANAGQSVAELFDPVTNTWSTTGPSTYTRSAGSSVFLSSGKVLYMGTLTAVGGQTIAELYDPSLNTWATTGTATYNRHDAGLVLLPNGKVFVLGSGVANGGRSIAELYDPVTQAFSTTGPAVYARSSSTSRLLNNSKVLTVGSGQSNSGRSIAELYDPVTNTFSTTGPSTYARSDSSSALLNNGKLLVTGTSLVNGGQSIAELYDPSTNTWATTAPTAYIHYAGFQLGLTLLNSGKVLLVGSGAGGNGLSIPELYLPAGDMQVSNGASPVSGLGIPWPERPDVKGVLGEQRNPVLAVDTSDNAAVAWEDARYQALRNWALSFNYNATTYQQTNINLAAAGVCNGGGGQNNSCGAIPALNSSPLRIMGQKLSGTDGSKQWGDDVNAVNQNNPEDLGLASTGDYSANPSIAADGTNFVVSWESNGGKPPDGGGNSKNYDIYGQKFDTNGASGWGGTWATTGTATYAREYHTATILNNGKVLVTGSGWVNGGRTIAELYDPSTQAWSTTGTATYARDQDSAIFLNNGKVLVAGNGLVNGGQSIAELYDPSTQAFSTTGILIYSRYFHTLTLLNSGKVLAVGTNYSNSGQSIAELYDPSTQAFSTTGTSTYARGNHAATLLGSGKVLVTGAGYINGGQSIAELYDPSTQAFSTTGTMTYARDNHTATLLNNGKVLIVGVDYINGGRTIAELYDPSTQAFSTTGTMTYARDYHTATLLNNGKVLVTGTSLTNGGQSIPELYDPSTQAWSTTGYNTYSRDLHTATLLTNGKVLVAGDDYSNGGQSIAELYSVDQMISSGKDLADQRYPDVAVDSGSNYIFAWQGRRGSGPGGGVTVGDSERGGGSWKIYGQKTNSSGTSQWPSGTVQSWSTTGTSIFYRDYHTATLLNSGKVLLAGTGYSAAGQSIAELYDPSTQAFSTTGTSTYARYWHTATLLNNGKVLLTGTGFDNGGQSIAELYDPSTQAFSTTGTMTYARYLHTATFLNSGKVLLVGTALSNGGLTIAELYDPSTQVFSTTGISTYARDYHNATPLNSGKVLLVGSGFSVGGQSIAELYDPSTQAFSTTGTMTYARYVPNSTLLNNGKVLVAGTFLGNGGMTIAELYDPSTQAFSTTGTMTYARHYSANNLLPSGKVLLIGSSFTNGGRTIAELYDPAIQSWSTTGVMTYVRDTLTTTLLGGGKVLVIGTAQDNGGRTIAELYTPELSEMMMSHDFGMKGDQIYPKLVTSGTNTYAVWQDNRSAISNTITSDYNVFMQSFDSNGVPQWPAATSNSGFSSPYAVEDIRADTYAGGWGVHYSGKPSIGGIFTGTGTAPFVLAWEDNRTSGDKMDVFGQSYDTVEQDISKHTNWTAYWDHNLATVNLNVNVGITEWDGTSYVENGQGSAQTWNVTSQAAGEDSLTWTAGGSPAPPSDQVGNVSMRRLIVTFTRASGSVTIYSDNSSSNYDSRLGTGDVVPEKVLILGLIIPFLPPAVAWYNRRRKKANMRIECEFK